MVNDTFIGIEIGGTKIQIVKGNGNGEIDQRIRYAIDAAAGAEKIRSLILKGIDELNAIEIAGAGIGFGGPINWSSGSISRSHQVNGWENFELKKWMEEILKKPVTVDNDANVAGLAEAVKGAGKYHEKIFYMTIGSGIGGGMVVDKKIYHGKSPGEAEIGHIRLDKKGNILESLCSGWAVNKKVRDYINSNGESLLIELSKNSTAPESALLLEALEKKDKAAKVIIEDVADNLAFALSHVVHLFHPEIIILGGGLSLLKQHLAVPVYEKLSGYMLQAFLPPPPIVPSALAEDAVPAGALILAGIYNKAVLHN